MNPLWPCPQCSQRRTFSPEEAGDLISRDFGKPIRQVSRANMVDKPGDPPGWLDHVEKSMLETQRNIDPASVISTERGLEIAEGNHRSWVAHRHGLRLEATVLTSRCGCTEAAFIDSMNAWTRSIGWMHHQQGF